jgi:hypothetical protein
VAASAPGEIVISSRLHIGAMGKEAWHMSSSGDPGLIRPPPIRTAAEADLSAVAAIHIDGAGLREVAYGWRELRY